MRAFEKIEQVCEQCGLEIDEEGFERKMGIVRKLGDENGSKPSAVRGFKGLIKHHAICKNLKFVKNKSGMKVPRRLQQKINFDYDFHQNEMIVSILGVRSSILGVRRITVSHFSDEFETYQEFYKEVLSQETINEYKIKKSFDPNEAELFLEKSLEEYTRKMVEKFNENKLKKLASEIDHILDAECS